MNKMKTEFSILFIKPRQNLLNAAGRVGEASHAVLRNIGEEDAIDKEIQVSMVYTYYP